jgi:NADH dehydrogenase
VLSDGTEIETRTIVWCAGVRPSDPLAAHDVPRTRAGRLRVDERLRVPGVPRVFAIGDAAAVATEGGELPMVSPPAMQEGRHVARQILADVAGRGDRVSPFRYRDKGMMAVIGRNAAVVDLRGLRLRGFLGWVVWLTVHLYYLVGFRNRLLVFASWGWNYIRKDRPIRLIVESGRDRVTEELLDEAAHP